MTDTTVPRDLLTGLPSRRKIAELILSETPSRDTFAGWQHFRATRSLLVPTQRLSASQWRTLPPRRRDDYDTYRQMTNVNLPLQQTPMAQKASRLIDRRLSANTRKKGDPTLAGVMVSGWGQHGKTATVCRVVAAFEDRWLRLHNSVNPASVPGTVDLHSPVAYVQAPVTATPKSTCVTILNFFNAPSRSLTLPQVVRQVAESLRDHGVKVLIIDDINRLRMHRADDQDVLDLIRAFMGLDVTLILTGVNIPGTGLLREARWHPKQRSWVMPPLESTRVHGLEVTQTERRFELVELDRFRTTTPAGIQAFVNHLQGIEEHLRLLNARDGMLTEGTLPEYLMRRTNGVVGLLGRLIEDGCLEAMASGKAPGQRDRRPAAQARQAPLPQPQHRLRRPRAPQRPGRRLTRAAPARTTAPEPVATARRRPSRLRPAARAPPGPEAHGPLAADRPGWPAQPLGTRAPDVHARERRTRRVLHHHRPLDAGPYAFVWVDALTQKVREGGRIINVHALIAVGVNADGHREILGIDVATAEDGAGWLAFLRSLIARGLTGVQLVISDAHAGLVDAIGAVLPGSSWQRCRTHYARNLLSQVPKSAQPWVATLLRTVFEQPDTDAVKAQMRHVLDALEAKFPKAAAHLDAAQHDLLAFTAFPREIWRQIW